MQYAFKAHPTRYLDVLFRSRLEARWAAFFQLKSWKWDYEAFDFHGWTPDFLVEIPCGHSECFGNHSLLAEVKPYRFIEHFTGHRCMDFSYGVDRNNLVIPACASAALGYSPQISYFQMSHGAGGGVFSIPDWADDWEFVWKKAGELTRYLP